MKNPGPYENPIASGGEFARRPGVSGGGSNHPLVWAGVVLGMGFGGLADGIVLHSILGWHHLICASAGEFCQPTSIEQLKLENTQDGYFDLALWLVLLAGTAMLFRHGKPASYLALCWQGAECSIFLRALLTTRFSGSTTFSRAVRISSCSTCYTWRTGQSFS
jgi:hypothetical protein